MDRVKVVYYKSQSATSINYKNVVKFCVCSIFDEDKLVPNLGTAQVWNNFLLKFVHSLEVDRIKIIIKNVIFYTQKH